jgi:hypothetical protein
MFEIILKRRTATLVGIIAKQQRITREEALRIFSASDTYRKLSNEKTKYWRESDPYIWESYDCEMKGLPINDDY